MKDYVPRNAESRMKMVGAIRVQVLIGRNWFKVLADYPEAEDFLIDHHFDTAEKAFYYYDHIEKHLFLVLARER